MKRLLAGLAGLIVLFAAVVVIVPFLLPKETIRRQVVTQVENATGWRLRLDGDVSLAVVPGLRLIADDVGLSGEAGADGVEFLKAQRIDFGLAWMALLSGNVRLTHVEMEAPEILLEISANGQSSWAPRQRFPADRWSVATQNGAQTTATSEADAPEDAIEAVDAAGGSLALLERVGVDEFSINGGSVVYADSRNGSRQEVQDVDLAVRLPSLAGPLDLEGAFTYAGIRATVDGGIEAPLALSRGGESEVRLTLKALEATFGVEGTVSLSPSGLLRITADGPSSAPLLKAFGIVPARDPGAFAMIGSLAAAAEGIKLESARLALGRMSASLSGMVDTSGSLPVFASEIEARGIDFAEALVLAGRSETAGGTISADLSLRGAGFDAATILGSLDLRGRLSLEGGTISGLGLADSFAGDKRADTLSDMAMSVTFDGLDKPVEASGALAWRGEAFTLKGQVVPAPYLAGLAAPVKATVSGARVSLGFDGSLATGGEIDGDVLFSSTDLRGLAGWLGQPIASGGGLKNFRIEGKLAASPDRISFTRAAIELDEIKGKGETTLVLSKPMKVTAKLDLDQLVLDPYLGAGEGPPNGDGKKTAGAPSKGEQGWSSEPIDFSGLRAVDATLELSAKSIRWDELEIGKSALSVNIEGGVLTADLAELSLYDGAGAGKIRLDGSASVPSLAGDFNLVGLRALPFLKAATGFDSIDGKLSSSFDMKTSGQSEAELVSALAGNARFDFVDGAILGINIPQMVRGLGIQTLLGWSDNSTLKTDFNALSASFTVENGVARSQDLSMSGPLIRMTGSGAVDMPQRTLDWRFEPKVVPTLEGQAPVPVQKGESRELAGLGVPVVVRGPWAKPQIYPDIKGILENPEAAYKQLESLGGGLVKALKGKPDAALAETANKVLEQAIGGNGRIDVQNVIEGKANDQQVLDAVEQGFGLPKGLLGSFGLGGKKKAEPEAAPAPQQ